jgi:hypothetical protein
MKKTRESQVILSWQLSQIVRTIHIMVMGSHLLKRKLEVHASEEIRFYLCQNKFVNNIDPNVLYNAETLRLLWEILWECLEANKTGDMTVLERINYRSSVLMWSWKELTGKIGHAEPEVTGDRHPRTGALLHIRRRKGAIDHRAHEQINQIPPEIEYTVNLWRSNKHRKMFPTFYRGDLVAPSADSIASHNQLILKLLGDASAAKQVMQTVDRDGTVIRRSGDGYSSSSSSSSSLNTSEESYSSYSSDSGDDLSENGHSSDDSETSKRRRRKRQSRLRREQHKARKITQLQLSGSDDNNSDASLSSESDVDGDLDQTMENNISRAISMTGLSSIPLSARGRKRASTRRRSVVARGLVGFGKALLH